MGVGSENRNQAIFYQERFLKECNWDTDLPVVFPAFNEDNNLFG